MKFLYEYRTKDNVRHEGVVRAATRDAAFAALKAQGIRPGSVTDAPGFFNKLFGKGKRWMAIVLLAAGMSVLLLMLMRLRNQSEAVLANFESEARRQVIGDAAIIAKGISTGWADVFPGAGERFLASFALPGQPPSTSTVDEADFKMALNRKIAVATEDSLEVRQIKSIVEGMKKEARAYIAEGGTFAKYRKRLLRRQQTEIGYYQRAEREIEALQQRKATDSEIAELWEKRNAELRPMGIRLVPMLDRKE